MKNALTLLLCLFGLLPLSAQETVSINGFWDYATGDSARYDGYVTLPADDQTVRNADSGKIWYRRTVYVPESWRRYRVSLFLERPNARTSVYVNGIKQGVCKYIFAPHRYEIATGLVPGERNTIEICVENPPRNWEGITGRMELRAQSRNVFIRQVHLRPFPFEGIVQVDLTLDGSFTSFYNEYAGVYIQREGSDADVQALFKKYNLKFHSDYHILDDTSIMTLIGCGKGISVMATLTAKGLENNLDVLKLDPEEYRVIGLSCINKKLLSPAARAFYDAIVNYVRNKYPGNLD